MSTAQSLPASGSFSGMTKGDAIIPAGADMKVSGMIGGDLIVEEGARVLISGMVRGKVVNKGAEVTITGMTG